MATGRGRLPYPHPSPHPTRGLVDSRNILRARYGSLTHRTARLSSCEGREGDHFANYISGCVSISALVFRGGRRVLRKLHRRLLLVRDKSEVMSSETLVTCFKDGLVPSGCSLERQDLWVRDGRIVEPQQLFFREKRSPDFVFDCSNHLVAPGFIDIQINGGFGVDFSRLRAEGVADGLATVAKGLLAHGVTSFCPTIITSTAEYYASVLPEFTVKEGGLHGAAVLGGHLEGPFISQEKKGAHSQQFIQSLLSPSAVMTTYGCLDNVRIITLAPELVGAKDTIWWLSRQKGVVVSVGHSMAEFSVAEEAVRSGASLITHLFNAMLPFHHRDPGIVGLLTSQPVEDAPVYYSLIADGNHTHKTVQRIAYRGHPRGCVLVTDAMAGMGMRGDRFSLGEGGRVEVVEGAARLAGTTTLAGSLATMDQCVRHFMTATDCSRAQALQAASLHPAQVLHLLDRGRLESGARADLVILDQSMIVQATFIAGRPVWTSPGSHMNRQTLRYNREHATAVMS